MVYESILSEVTQKVSLGNKIVDAMNEVDEQHEFFPPDFLQMLAV